MEDHWLQGFMIGLFIGVAVAGLTSILVITEEANGIHDAQRSYTECISLQAPREECLKRYLLPEEK